METNHEILVDYLDKQLPPEKVTAVENLLKENATAASDLQFLQLARETVRLDAIQQQVSAIRQSFRENQTASVKPAIGIVRNIYRISLRVAALVFVLAGTTFLYKYMSVNNQSVYEKQFAGYDLSNTRGQDNTDAETEAYKNKNWSEVISLFNKQSHHSNKSIFLTAISEMQQNQFPQAIALFESLLNKNSLSNENNFQEETEYYLSLAYLMNHEPVKSVRLLDKMKADPNHTYHPLAVKISSIDLKIIELKN